MSEKKTEVKMNKKRQKGFIGLKVLLFIFFAALLIMLIFLV